MTAGPGGPDPAATASRLGRLWAEILGRSHVAAEDDFFDLGGDSLAAVELMAKVRAEFGVDADILDLFDHPTLGEMSAHLGEALR